MVDFDEFVVMREDFLRELNIAVDKVIKEKESIKLDYDLIEKSLGVMLRNVRNLEVNPISALTPIKKEDMIKITLDFFKSIDSEFHKKAINTILQQNENIKMNIYNIHEVKDFSKEDELGLLKYTHNGNVECRSGFARVNVPTRREVYSEEQKILSGDECLLEDLYTIVHETTHLFDLDLEKDRIDRDQLQGGEGKRKEKTTRELLGEATTIVFEDLLSEYLLNNTSISKYAIQEMYALRLNSNLQDARMVYSKLLLAKEKGKSGEITSEFVEKLMRDNGFTTQYIRKIANDIIHNPRGMLYQKRYALGALISPTIIKKYKEEGVGALKEYLEEAKNENFEGALKNLGIEINDQGLNELIKNLREHITNLNMKAR